MHGFYNLINKRFLNLFNILREAGKKTNNNFKTYLDSAANFLILNSKRNLCSLVRIIIIEFK